MLTMDEPALLVLYSDGLVESREADIDQQISRLARAAGHGLSRTLGR